MLLAFVFAGVLGLTGGALPLGSLSFTRVEIPSVAAFVPEAGSVLLIAFRLQYIGRVV